MDLYVQKRNETVVPLNKNKIAGAIMKAVKASHSPESYFDINIADMLADKVYDDIVKFTVKNNTDSISYKDILDMTERALIKGGYSDTAKEYILYRQKKDEIINSRDSISKSIKDILLVQSNESDTKRENGNIDGDTAMGNMLQTGSAVAKNFYINNLVPKHIAKAHLSGDIHIHDLDFLKLTVTCCQIDFLKLARNGFNTGHGKIRPGKSILTAATLSAIAIQSDQNDCHGGQSIPNLDYALVPGLCHSFIKIVAKELANYCCTLYNGQYNRRIEMAKEIKDKIKQYMIDNDLEDFTFKEFDKYIVSKYSPFFPIGKDEKEIQAIKQFCIETLDTECFQAMEALIANLNTMHCLPAFQKIWVKDTNNRIRTISMSTLYDTFNEEEYQALSYNLKTLKWEWKRITNCVCNGIRDKLVMTRANTGESVYTTDNHKFISRDPETTGFKEAFPKTLSEVLINKNFTNGRHLYNESDPITDESSTWLEINYDGLVYDISVEDNENFITDNGILVHNSRAGAQVPFSSINLGTNVTEEGQMIIKNFLLATEKGLGNGETPIFPISIFKLKAGVNKLKTDPGYHLFKLACRVSAKRLFPNFSFLDAPHNAQYYKPGRPETEVAYMGCVVAKETITVNIEDITYSNTPISKMYKIIREYITYKTGQKPAECSHGYINTSDFDIKILSKNTFVKLHGILRNKDTVSNPLIEVFYTDNKTKDPKSIIVTTDHPLVSQKGRTPAENLEIGDTLYNSINNDEYEITNIIHLDYKEDTYDVETENDLFDLSGILSHNCRTRVIGNFYDTENETTYGRGNLSFTSINLPRLAIEAKGNTEKFFKDLFTTMDLVKEQLLDRLEIQSRLHVYNMPFLMGQGVWCGSDKLSYTDEIREVIKQGSLSIGFIGLAEALHALYGKHHGESEEIHNIGKKIIQFMRYRCDEYAKEHKLNFSLLATPAEGLSGRFLNIDKKKYGIIPGVTDKDYYTNSFHIPVGFDISIAKKIELEAPFHAMTNAGHITYVELDGDIASNEEVFEKIILKMDKEGVGYGSINHPIDRDPVCGYTGIIHEECPNCGRKEKEDGVPHERIRRITGYLVGTLDRFNSAKLSEVLDRKKHKGFKSEDIIQ